MNYGLSSKSLLHAYCSCTFSLLWIVVHWWKEDHSSPVPVDRLGVTRGGRRCRRNETDSGKKVLQCGWTHKAQRQSRRLLRGQLKVCLYDQMIPYVIYLSVKSNIPPEHLTFLKNFLGQINTMVTVKVRTNAPSVRAAQCDKFRSFRCISSHLRRL